MTTPPAMPEPAGSRTTRVAAVAIGRNEGDRLSLCLASLADQLERIVYVDSGSSDDSVARARAAAVATVRLDATAPFTAARGRNAGFRALEADGGAPDYVLFIDGDCELEPGWTAAALAALDAAPDVAVVCGRRRERFPDASVYNLLCDMEWDTPVGEAAACGGDSVMRAEALRAVGGFDPTLIAGEEPDLCLRMRRRGWRVLRLDHPMTVHDAAMTRFSQWWRRMLRSGWAYAEGAWRHGRGPERYNLRAVARIALWGVATPAAAAGALSAAAAGAGAGWAAIAAAAAAVYPAMAARVARRRRRAGEPPRRAWAWGVSVMLAKPAQAIGVGMFALSALRRRQARLIEYKRADHSS